MKQIFLTIALITAVISTAQPIPNQQVNFGNNTPDNRSEWYRPNTPTNNVGNREVVGWIKSWDVFHMQMDTIRFTKLNSTVNKGTPIGVLWTDSKGNLKHSPLSEFRLPYNQVTSPPFIPSTKADIGLGNADNTSDLNKPVSTAQQIALDAKVPITRTVNGKVLSVNISIDKTDVGLSNVNNTSDADKPISSATQIALDGKLSAEVDGSVTNEIQQLSIAGYVLSINGTGGNSVILPSPAARVFKTPTFAEITTASQLSTTRDSYVSYDIPAAVSIVVLAGQSVNAKLQYADNSGMTTNLITLSSQTISNSGLLGLTQGNTLKLCGIVPSGKYRKVIFTVTGTGVSAPSTAEATKEFQL